MTLSAILRKGLRYGALALAFALPAAGARADQTPQALPFSQNWSNTGLITANDNWSGVPGIEGYLGQDITTATGTDPQTLLGVSGVANDLDVIANLTVSTSTSGGVGEFHGTSQTGGPATDPVVGLQGSGTADAPYLLITLTTTSQTNITVSYNLRDIDCSADNTNMQVALQYRVGTSGNFTNVPAGYVSDASSGGSLCTLVTPVTATLPAAVDNQATVQVRIMTTNAAGNDEWIGVDDISITAGPVSTPPSGNGSASPNPVPAGVATLLTVATTQGTNPAAAITSVVADTTSIGGTTGVALFDNGTNGDVTSGDGTWSRNVTVAANTTSGGKSVSAVITDAQSRTGNVNISLTVLSPAGTLPDLFFSEYVESSVGNNKAVEIFNPGLTAVDLGAGGYDVQNYANGATTATSTTALTGTIQPGGTFVLANSGADTAILNVAQQTSGNVNFNGDDTFLLRKAGAVIDVIGRVGEDPGTEWGTGLASTADNTIRRRANFCQGDNNQIDAFDPVTQWDGFADQTYGGLGTHNATCGGATSNPSGFGQASPNAVSPGQQTLLTVTVTPGANPTSTGLAVSVDVSPLGGSSTQAFSDDGATGGDLTAGDNVFSWTQTAGSVSAGAKTLNATITDGQSRTGTTTITVTIIQVATIMQIQGTGVRSPLEGVRVKTTGIVTGRRNNGFYMQDPTGDADVTSSDGVFVFTSSTPPAGAAVGNSVEVVGTVQEFDPEGVTPPGVTRQTITELSSSPTVVQLSTGNPVPTAISLPSSALSTTSFDTMERYEHMRVTVPSLTVVAPSQGSITESSATVFSTGVFFGVLPGVARPFREVGLSIGLQVPTNPAPPCCIPRFDDNPERLRVDSDALTQPALDVTVGATLTNLTGIVEFAFASWNVYPDTAIVSAGNTVFTPVPAAAGDEFTVGAFNMERFFDTVDFTGPGCPGGPNCDDPVLTQAAFDKRLGKASLAIRNVMLAPDILGVVEMENLTTLQAVAARLNTDIQAATGSNPGYVAYLEEGNDIGGIDVGFLVKSTRVTVVSVTQEGKTATYINPNTSLPETLNDRPPLVLQATVGGQPITVVVNHLRSLGGVESVTDNRVRAKRAAQAEFLANLLQTLQGTNGTNRVISVGDFNAFQFNDGYVDVMGTVIGQPTPSTQVMVASSDLVNPNFTFLSDLIPAADRYSYSFDGNAQILDHMVVSQGALRTLRRFAYGRGDSDFPVKYYEDGTRAERLSDHDQPVAYFANAAPQITISDVSQVEGNAGTTTFTFNVDLTPASGANVTVAYATGDGLAAAPGDYVAQSGTLTFTPGQTRRTVAVVVNGDTSNETNETFFVNLSGAVSADIADSQGLGNILNDDGATLTTSVSTIFAGRLLNVTVTGGPGNATDWIGLYAVGAADSAFLDWKYLNGTQTATTGATTATVPFRMPATAGTYQFRFFASNSTALRLATSPNVTVNAPTLTPSAMTAPTNAVISVAVANGPGNRGDWVGLFTLNAADTNYLDWKYLSNTQTLPSVGVENATLTFTLPSTAGSYEFRFFVDSGFSRLTRSASVTVGTSSSLSATPSSTVANQTATITVNGASGGNGDWVGQYRTGAADSAYLDWRYLNNSQTLPGSGVTSATITMPMQPLPGTYEFRLFLNGTFSRMATSNTVTVNPPTVTPSQTTVAPGTVVTFTVSNGPARRLDWLGLYTTSAPDPAYSDWKYLGSNSQTPPGSGVAAGSVTFTMPTTPGTYQVRFFFDNGGTRLATSANVTVQ